ncbi:MAG TPA: ATP-binding protein [Bryobacteraceae bacterium]|nr:ATP-binding protein [Bryobacteraceae bacterium]HOL73092.1 ATP-binding protein [Bryobacteraceae bacterium]HOQ46003.1 ATP-binding protein [Bryobacteraceae bacterium]HPQ13578.1 ATP-binding protein [Bryobacteraceae bacterium]HPU73786.1 ATP-binding protein [Bryobacteraceae bacterium]
MRKRLLHISGVVLLIISATLVIWQGSFSFGDYAPVSPEQTFLYWAVSTLVFLLTVTLGFMLFRTGVRLYIERRSNREGSRIKTKLVIGALALTFMPMFFLVLWGVYVLNYNLAKWFSAPAQGVRNSFAEMVEILNREAEEKAAADAAWLAERPETISLASGGGGSLARACRERNIVSAVLVRNDSSSVSLCGTDKSMVSGARAPVEFRGRSLGFVLVAPQHRADLAERKDRVEQFVRDYDKLTVDRRGFRNFYVLLLLLITLFIQFFATWVALFLSKQISTPIEALLKAAGEVRRGNLAYRVKVRAIDELASLVRAFNEMTHALEANSRELEQRRRFTEAILESIPSGVISISSDGRILRVNRALRQLFEEEKVAAASRLEDLFSREETADIKYMMKRARRTGVVSRQMELKNGRGSLHLSVTLAALEEGPTSGFVMVLEDTSELLRAQRIAAWQEVARRIAHEMKNPLTPIALCSDRIARQLERLNLPPDAQRILRECTSTISGEVETVKTLVNEFSQFAGFPAAQPVPCDLNEVVESALAVFAGRLEDIQIHKEFAPGLPLVNIDPRQFKRVVINLIDNADESMQDSVLKHLYVITRATAADTVELIVADTGCGVAAEDRDRLFLPYFSTKGRGTGLGLAIVSRILAEHNAKIRVEDNEPQGARFIVEIPVVAGVEADPKTQEARA